MEGVAGIFFLNNFASLAEALWKLPLRFQPQGTLTEKNLESTGVEYPKNSNQKEDLPGEIPK